MDEQPEAGPHVGIRQDCGASGGLLAETTEKRSERAVTVC